MLILLSGISCTPDKPRYVIGVSQCSDDIWREKQNAELRMGAYFQDGVELRFAAAYDSVQLYRKVKSLTGSTPVELLRTARLKRGYQLLLTTDKSVSEVAYQVGFTAPSYFTKCFKDEYGKLPGELRN